MDKNIDTENKKVNLLFFSEETGKKMSIGGIIFLVLAIIVFIRFGSWEFSPHLNEEKVGQFGDFIGGVVGTIFSLVGIILFYIALKEQRKDIKINQDSAKLQTEALKKQIEEFELQRSELEETRKIVKEQSETLRYQRFESTFFQLLSLHHQIVNAIDEIEQKTGSPREKFAKSGAHEHRAYVVHAGRDVFKRTYERLIHHIRAHPDNDFIKIYLPEYEKSQTDFGHYFRNLYRILKFISGSKFTENSEENYQIQYQYTSMVRAQLSDYELLWIFYNCLSENGLEKFKPLIERYCFFKNLPKDKIHDLEIINQYTEGAFDKAKVQL